MTVSELKLKLEQFPSEMEVFVSTDGYPLPIEIIEIDKTVEDDVNVVLITG